MSFRCDGVLDLECADWATPVMACAYQPGDVRVHRTIDALVDDLLERGGTWWAHCGGRYDFLPIVEVLKERGISCVISMSGSRISRCVGGGIVLADSYGLIPMGLEKACRIIGREAATLGLPCKCRRQWTAAELEQFANEKQLPPEPEVEHCGGYCSISVRMSESMRRVVADYCVQDCKDLYEVIHAIMAFAERIGLDLKGTIGGTAWATARRLLELPDASFPSSVWRRIGQGYYGGRVALCRPNAQGPGTHWDLGSAYPAALAKTSVPCGDWGEIGGPRAVRAFARQRPGIYHAVVDVPECYLPPLPVRSTSRISYPHGRVRGTWTRLELDAAVERGAKVVGISWAVLWADERVIFADLIDAWYAIRLAVGKSSALGEWMRLLANSLTGKLAESPEREAVRLHPDSIRICLRAKPCTRTRCVCNAYRQIDEWGYIWGAPYWRPAPSGHKHWAAYATAATRIAWLAGAESQGRDLVYGDTDSIWTTGRTLPRPNGDGLGEWMLKGTFERWQAVAPKVYRYHDGKGWVSRTAGIKDLSDEEWESMGRGETVSRHSGVESFLQAAQSGEKLFRRKRVSWGAGRENVTGRYGDRILDPEDRLTYPPKNGTQAAGNETNWAEPGGPEKSVATSKKGRAQPR